MWPIGEYQMNRSRNPTSTDSQLCINKDKVVSSGIGQGVARPVEDPRQQALTAGDGVLLILFSKSRFLKTLGVCSWTS